MISVVGEVVEQILEREVDRYIYIYREREREREISRRRAERRSRCMYYSWIIGGQTVPQLYSTSTTYVLPLFDRYVLRNSAIQQVRTKNRFALQPGICRRVKVQILF